MAEFFRCGRFLLMKIFAIHQVGAVVKDVVQAARFLEFIQLPKDKP